MRHLIDGTLFFLGLFLLSCDNFLVVIIGLVLMVSGACFGGALQIKRKKPRAWRH